MSEVTFGARASGCTTAAALLDLERSDGREARFALTDALLAELISRCLRGERLFSIERVDREDRVELIGAPHALAAALEQNYALEKLQARGAWFLPEVASLKGARVTYPAHARLHPRFAHTLAHDDRGRAKLASGQAVVFWAVVEPLMTGLLDPIELRTGDLGTLERSTFEERWAAVLSLYVGLGLRTEPELAAFRWGGGWAQRNPEQIWQAKTALLGMLAQCDAVDIVRRYRALATAGLIRHYYAKAKKGRARRKQVVVKEHQRTLAGFFGGDWLAFVDYLGEAPHEEEEIHTSLPEARVFEGGKPKLAAAAALHGIPPEELDRMLGAFWETGSGESPIHRRVSALRGHWAEFDAIHARQDSGMPPLWGLVEESGWNSFDPEQASPHQALLYRRLLSPSLVADVDHLWGTAVVAKAPTVIVSEPFAHVAMASAAGPALRFWHGCALTAWFVCEGPSSRTDIPGMAAYYRRELLALEELGCPVHAQLFDELRAAPIGDEEPIYSDVGSAHGITMRMSAGTRRRGFQLLRDVITRYRRWWATHFLEKYLRAQWEVALKAAAREYHRASADKGKAPTLKQFAKHAVEPASLWFGGNIALMYGALGLKFVGEVERRTILPADRHAFAARLFATLGGVPFKRDIVVSDREAARVQSEAQDHHHKLRRLAHEAYAFVQLHEALGRVPSRKEFGSKFDWLAPALASDLEAAWTRYVGAIADALR